MQPVGFNVELVGYKLRYYANRNYVSARPLISKKIGFHLAIRERAFEQSRVRYER